MHAAKMTHAVKVSPRKKEIPTQMQWRIRAVQSASTAMRRCVSSIANTNALQTMSISKAAVPAIAERQHVLLLKKNKNLQISMKSSDGMEILNVTKLLIFTKEMFLRLAFKGVLPYNKNRSF